MLILPPGHTESLAIPRRLSKREKWMVGGVLAAVAVIALALVISFASSGPSSNQGCIYATIAGPVGAEQIHLCGSDARATCRSVNRPGAFSVQAAPIVAAACRKAGLPVGSQ